jgi:phosphohistidine swiveling domain-containing protein
MHFALIHQATTAVSDQQLAKWQLPIQGVTRLINSYVFNAARFRAEEIAPPAVDQATLDAMVAGLGERWRTSWLPEIAEHLAYWRAFDLQGADLPTLVAHLTETEARIHRLEAIHFDVVTDLLLAVDLFEKMVADLFTNADGSVDPGVNVHTLLAGFEAKGTESSRALWQLSRRALATPAVRQILAETPASAVLDRLGNSADGQAFLREFNDFLATYGYQGDKNYIDRPTLDEDPTLAIQSIQGYMQQPDRDLVAEGQRIVAQREAALATVRERLQGYPQPMVTHFEFLLQAAQEATWLREEHAHQLDMPLNHCVRRLLLALGQRLQAAGVLERREDIFYLTPDEVRATVAIEPLAAPQALVRQRRTTAETYAAIAPPLMFGPLPTQVLPSHPIVAAHMQNAGDPSQAAATPTELKGMPASAGKVRGTARVLHDLTEAGKLQPGDILVTTGTVPAWTPLFANIAGLVTMTGGPLSHAAVVAREFGIPAVVGAAGATAFIQDGQLIEVDGNRGVVLLHVLPSY